jgi:hypothetical protein
LDRPCKITRRPKHSTHSFLIMATWKVTAFINSSVGTQSYEIDSSTPYGARDLVQKIYNPEQIYKVEEVSTSSYYDSSSSDGGLGAVVGFLLCIWLFFWATPFVMMFLFGILGTKTSEFLVGDKLEPALTKSLKTDKNGAVIFILIIMMLSGGFGFYAGDKIQKFFSNNQSSIIKK